jgi:YggT family protein
MRLGMVAFQVLYWLIIARVILSFFRSPYNPVTRFVYEITEPILAPFRRILPKGGMIDFSPFLAILSLNLLEWLLLNLIRNMSY